MVRYSEHPPDGALLPVALAKGLLERVDNVHLGQRTGTLTQGVVKGMRRGKDVAESNAI